VRLSIDDFPFIFRGISLDDRLEVLHLPSELKKEWPRRLPRPWKELNR
jgi:hypothetical protein